MSDPQVPAQRTPDERRTPTQRFGAMVMQTAQKQLVAMLGTEAGKKAAHTVTMAMVSAMQKSKTPGAFLDVTEASIADCVATSYETQLYPGGPNPTVYLVPQAPRRDAQPELQWRITHRGLSILAARAGYTILAIPVSVRDRIVVQFGEAVEHEADPADWPGSLDDILGCILVIRRASDGITLARPWMPRAAIAQRKGKSRNGDVWNEWPIEQAQKTVIKWGFARGYVPLDSPELRAALDADNRGDIIDTTAEVVSTQPAPRSVGVRQIAEAASSQREWSPPPERERAPIEASRSGDNSSDTREEM